MSYSIAVTVTDDETGEIVFDETTAYDDPVVGLRYIADDVGGEIAAREESGL